jgi:hypothetical protein
MWGYLMAATSIRGAKRRFVGRVGVLDVLCLHAIVMLGSCAVRPPGRPQPISTDADTQTQGDGEANTLVVSVLHSNGLPVAGSAVIAEANGVLADMSWTDGNGRAMLAIQASVDRTISVVGGSWMPIRAIVPPHARELDVVLPANGVIEGEVEVLGASACGTAPELCLFPGPTWNDELPSGAYLPFHQRRSSLVGCDLSRQGGRFRFVGVPDSWRGSIVASPSFHLVDVFPGKVWESVNGPECRLLLRPIPAVSATLVDDAGAVLAECEVSIDLSPLDSGSTATPSARIFGRSGGDGTICIPIGITLLSRGERPVLWIESGLKLEDLEVIVRDSINGRVLRASVLAPPEADSLALGTIVCSVQP